MNERLKAMMLGWGSIGLAYFTGGMLQGAGHLLSPSAIDRAIPYTQVAIWPYLSFFVLVPLAYWRCPVARLHGLMRAMQICALVAGAVYIIHPTTMLVPPVDPTTISGRLLALLMRADSPQNCLPSLHAALTALSIAVLLERTRPLRNAALVIWGSVIALSILMLRRHLMIDLITGLALAAFAGLIAHSRPVFSCIAEARR